MSATDFNAMVAEVARTKRRVDRIGGLLIDAERQHGAAVDALDRAIRDACAAPAAQLPRPAIKLTLPRATTVLAISAPMIDEHQSVRCGICRVPGHNARTCPASSGVDAQR